MKKVFLLILAALALGCLAESPKFTQTPTFLPVTPTPSATTSPTLQTPTPTLSETATTPAEFQFGVKYPAKVIYVYDGDTIKVNLSGQILIIRLLGIDTLEKISGEEQTIRIRCDNKSNLFS